jgi:hypothetical protein
MIEYRLDRPCDGQDIFFDGEKVGWMSFGDLRQMPQDRRPVTLIGKGTKHHNSIADAQKYVETFYRNTQGAI